MATFEPFLGAIKKPNLINIGTSEYPHSTKMFISIEFDIYIYVSFKANALLALKELCINNYYCNLDSNWINE